MEEKIGTTAFFEMYSKIQRNIIEKRNKKKELQSVRNILQPEIKILKRKRVLVKDKKMTFLDFHFAKAQELKRKHYKFSLMMTVMMKKIMMNSIFK